MAGEASFSARKSSKSLSIAQGLPLGEEIHISEKWVRARGLIERIIEPTEVSGDVI